ncbi:MAG: hypothetical protein ACKVZ0_11770 [Gemmatimonadales bacterium]
MRLALAAWSAAALLLATPLAAQVTPITVPKGQLRWDFYAQLESWDWRWRDGAREEAAAAFARPIVDQAFLPGLADTEARLKRMTGLSQLNLSLGQSIASQIVNRGTRGIGGAFGLTKSITVYGSVPVVSVRVEPRFVLDTTSSTLGANPGGAQYATFLNQLATALAALQSRIASGAFDPDPNLKALAQARLTYGQMLRADLLALVNDPATASPFLPTASSQVGASLINQIQALQSDLAAFGVTGFTASLSLPTRRASVDDFTTYLTDPTGAVAGRPLDEVPYLIRLGDVEVGVAVALIDRFPRSRMGHGMRTTLDATLRLRTGQLDRQDRFLDVGTGDRQPDVDVNLSTDLALGRFGVRLVGGYNLQLPGNQNRRIGPPDQPIGAATTQAGVRRDPGDVIRLSARPFLRLATHLSLYGGVDFWTRRADKFVYAAGQPPIDGADIDVLAIGTKADALLLSGGLSYSHSGEDKRGALGLPMDASFRYERVARSGSGILPDINSVRVDLRFYTRLWR